jgi:hypothetical protein
MPEKPKKRGPKPEHLIVAPERVGAVLDRLLGKKTTAKKPKKRPAR